MQRAVEKLIGEPLSVDQLHEGIVKRVDPHRFSAAQLKHKRCCSGRVSRGRFAQRRILLTNMRDAQLEQGSSPQPSHAKVGSSMDNRFGTTPEITISRYANF